METKNNFKFTQVPTNLFILLDNNCRSMLFTLIQLSTYYADENGWFFRTYADLEAESNLSQNLVKATLQTLFNHHLIEAKPTGQSKGKKPNYYKVNFEEFTRYEEYSIEDCMKNPDLKIRTVDYKGSHFTLNLVREKVEEVVKSDNNINNIYNIYNKNNLYNNINNIDNKNIKENYNNNKEEYIKEDSLKNSKEFQIACSEEMETEFENEVGISDDDFNWNDEILRFKAKLNKTKTKQELLNISRNFNKKMNDFNFPIELEEELETIKKVANSRMYALSL